MGSQRKPKASTQDLVAAIRSLARLHHNVTDAPASPATVIDALRARGQNTEADELERVIQRIKRRRQKARESRPPGSLQEITREDRD